MGVETQADIHLDQAAASVQVAIKHLSALVVDRCWGFEDYNTEYLQTIDQVFHALIEINRKLDR